MTQLSATDSTASRGLDARTHSRPGRRSRPGARRFLPGSTAITAFAVLLATSLDAWPFSTAEQGGSDNEPTDDVPPPPAGFGAELPMGDRIEELFASLAHGGGDDSETEFALLVSGNRPAPESEEGITGPLDLSSSLAQSLGVSDPAQQVGPIVVLHSAPPSAPGLPTVGGGAAAQTVSTGSDGNKSGVANTGQSDGSGAVAGRGSSGGNTGDNEDQDGQNDGDRDGGDEGSGGNEDDGDSGGDDNGGNDNGGDDGDDGTGGDADGGDDNAGGEDDSGDSGGDDADSGDGDGNGGDDGHDDGDGNGDGDDSDGDTGDGDDGGNDGDNDSRPLVTITDGGEVVIYRLDAALGMVNFIGEGGVETPVPSALATKLLALYAKTGRTAFDASELAGGLVLDTDVHGGAAGGGTDADDEDQGSDASVTIRVTDEDVVTLYRLENATGKVFVQTETGELELPGELASILADLHRETGKTEFTAVELDAGLDNGAGEDGDPGTLDDAGDDSEGADDGDDGVGSDNGEDSPDAPAQTMLEVSDAGEITLYRLDPATGKVFVQIDGGELELPPQLATILADLHHTTGRTSFTAEELDAGFGGDPANDDSGAGDAASEEPGETPGDDDNASPDDSAENAGDQPSWFHVRIHDGDETQVFWFDAETRAGHVDDGADGVPDAALEAVFASLILEMVEETGRTDFDATELAPDQLVVDNAVGGGGSGDFDLI